jgi:outer membrane protein assembly factor BamB
LPTIFEAKSRQINGNTLVSGQTYNYLSPYFSWSGSTDETEIDGYYVYFGVGETADPEVDGVYQSESSYLATTELNPGTYYLRVKVRDILGQVSEAVTGFTYKFSGVETVNLSFSKTDDFLGVGSSVLISNDEIKLAGKSGFWESNMLANALGNIYQGGGMAYVASSHKLYVMAGNSSKLFWSYDISNDTWATLATTPETVTYGGALVEGPDGFLYALRGGNNKDFWMYDIEHDSWTSVSSALQTVYYGASFVSTGGKPRRGRSW